MSARSSEQRLAELEQRLKWIESRVEPVLNAVFLDAAESVEDVLTVRLLGYDDGETVTGVPDGVVWAPRSDDEGTPVYPQVGDQAWVLEGDDGRWIVVQWQPS